MTDPLPPLGLDDLRVAEPDRDSEARFDAFQTMGQAFGAFHRGHSAGEIAALLVDLPRAELQALLAEMIER